MDFQLHLSDILLVGGGIWAYLRTSHRTISQLTHAVEDLTQALGSAHPPSGILGDISELKLETRRHRDWLIAAGVNHPSDRT
jgi:hypothetical protein